jgi:hypothetical protein
MALASLSFYTSLVQGRFGVFIHVLHHIHLFASPIEGNCPSDCPNIHHTTTASHIYYLDVIPPCPEGIPQLSIQCFHPNSNSFSNNKQYKFMEAPSTLLKYGFQVSIPGYGVVHLLGVAVKDTTRSKEWRVFHCIQECVLVAEVAARKEWWKVPERCLGSCMVSFCFLHL